MKLTHKLAACIVGLTLLTGAYVNTPRPASGQTQLEMDEQAYNDYLKADKDLNIVYRQLIHEHSGADDKITRGKIIAAERAWVAYRDAEANMEASIDGEGGSIYPQIVSLTCEQLTRDRIKQLKAIIAKNGLAGPGA